MTQANNSQSKTPDEYLLEVAELIAKNAFRKSEFETRDVIIATAKQYHKHATEAPDLSQPSESQANHELNRELAQDTQTLIQEARIDEDETWKKIFHETQETYKQAGMNDSYIYFTGLHKALDDRLAQLREGDKNDE